VRRYLLALVFLLVAADARAQRGRRSPFSIPEPAAFISLGAALQDGFTVRDGTSGSTWNFGSATQYTGSLERALSQGASFGIRGNIARVPLTVTNPAGSGDADALVSQLLASLYVTSGRTIHSVLEGDVGATIYSDFVPRAGSLAVVPSGADADFAFTFGYGLGYSVSPRMSVDVVRTIGTSMHQKTGLSASDESSSHVGSTRLIVRLGVGQQ
jgi:hypothetical protein